MVTLSQANFLTEVEGSTVFKGFQSTFVLEHVTPDSAIWDFFVRVGGGYLPPRSGVGTEKFSLGEPSLRSRRHFVRPG